ncbi:MAG TPA: LysM domain-containing protein [Acidiphilium sp.]
MSSKHNGLIIPPYPVSEPARSFVMGDVKRIERDLGVLQQADQPAHSLAWNAHDRDIQDVVSDYNNYLRTSYGYVSLDWQLIKAMLWTETGPHARDDLWNKKPMQSANQGDPGWDDMMRHGDRLDLIVPPNLCGAIASPGFNARDNIAAGVGYLLYRAAEFGPKTVIDRREVKTVTVERGDTLDAIAGRAGTTVEVLKDMNRTTTLYPLKIGTKLTYSPAKIVTVITGWKSIDRKAHTGFIMPIRAATMPTKCNLCMI